MSTADHAKHLNGLLRKIKPKYEAVVTPPRPALDELLVGVLLWDASTPKAEHAFKRLKESVVDYNELRVTRPAEIVAAVGKTYPRAEERSLRLHAALTEIYKREHDVTLDSLAGMSKRDAAKYVESLPGLPLFASKRLVLVCLGGHAMPVDDRMLAKLAAAGVVEAECDVAHAAGILERHVKADSTAETFALLQAWSEDPKTDVPMPRRETKPITAMTFHPPAPPPPAPVIAKKPTPAPGKSKPVARKPAGSAKH